MNKILILISCILGFVQLTNATQGCRIRTENNEWECVEWSDEEYCAQYKDHYDFTLTPSSKFKKIIAPVTQMIFKGDCDCDYTLYRKPNFCGIKYESSVFIPANSEYPNDTDFVFVWNHWMKEVHSIKVKCRF